MYFFSRVNWLLEAWLGVIQAAASENAGIVELWIYFLYELFAAFDTEGEW